MIARVLIFHSCFSFHSGCESAGTVDSAISEHYNFVSYNDTLLAKSYKYCIHNACYVRAQKTSKHVAKLTFRCIDNKKRQKFPGEACFPFGWGEQDLVSY